MATKSNYHNEERLLREGFRPLLPNAAEIREDLTRRTKGVAAPPRRTKRGIVKADFRRRVLLPAAAAALLVAAVLLMRHPGLSTGGLTDDSTSIVDDFTAVVESEVELMFDQSTLSFDDIHDTVAAQLIARAE